MLRFAICDDDIATTDRIKSLITELEPTYNLNFSISIFLSGEEFCFYLVIASKKNISIFADMIIPENLQVDSVPICQILGNALDNAIEATEMLDDSRDRIIQVYISYDQEVLFFKISNPFCGRIIINTKGRIVSKKRQPNVEGIGLQSIMNTVAKLHGNVAISHDGGEFCISITLYNIHVGESSST